jgi:choline dehydrogenase
MVSEWDVVIVGGGAAGCVLASRLSERAKLSVVLLEAGPDLRSSMPDDVRDGKRPTFSHDWGYVSEPNSEGPNSQGPNSEGLGARALPWQATRGVLLHERNLRAAWASHGL